jgi:hypothetical protein
MISREQEPAAEHGDSSAAVRLAFGGFRTVNLPLDRAVLSPSSPLLASDRGRLTGPHPIIKIGQEPEWRRVFTQSARILNRWNHSQKRGEGF